MQDLSHLCHTDYHLRSHVAEDLIIMIKELTERGRCSNRLLVHHLKGIEHLLNLVTLRTVTSETKAHEIKIDNERDELDIIHINVPQNI